MKFYRNPRYWIALPYFLFCLIFIAFPILIISSIGIGMVLLGERLEILAHKITFYEKIGDWVYQNNNEDKSCEKDDL